MKKFKILFGLLIYLIIVGISLNIYAATEDIQWTDFSQASVTLVDRKESEYREYDLKFENVTFDTEESTKYYVFIVNEIEKLEKFEIEKKDEVLENIATEVWISSSEKIVPYSKMNPFIDRNNDIYVWIVEGKLNEEGTYEFKNVLSGKKVEKPSMGKLGERIGITFDVHYGSMSTRIHMYEPCDSNENRKITLQLGKVTDYDVLLSMKEKEANRLQKLMDYAKDKKEDEVITKEVTLGTYFDLLGGVDLEKNAYYYVYSILDNENNKYRTIEDIELFQYVGPKDSSLYYVGEYDALASYNSLGFIWDNIEAYKLDSDRTENGDGQTNDGKEEQVKDDTLSKGTLPFTGEGILIFGLIIMIIVVGAYYGIRIKGLKNIK